MLQSTGALQRKLEEEQALIGELERDKERYDLRRNLEAQVRGYSNAHAEAAGLWGCLSGIKPFTDAH